MEGTWARIERWLAESAPDVLDSLQPGATEEQISNTEAALGVTLPDEVRASYPIHDGQSPDGPGLMDAWEFLSLSRMLDEWRIWKGLLDGGDLADAKSEPEEGVADDWWNPKWIPLTYSGSGDHHCLDLAPTPDGEVGQIILMYHDIPTRQVVARSFGAWLEAFADDLEAGCYVYDGDQYHGLVNKDEL